ncbi:MAG: hypothetical protein K2Q12_09420 [Rickettsiales bacterium]|nr:hypothetical protein [Rickettsiales bacterium]
MLIRSTPFILTTGLLISAVSVPALAQSYLNDGAPQTISSEAPRTLDEQMQQLSPVSAQTPLGAQAPLGTQGPVSSVPTNASPVINPAFSTSAQPTLPQESAALADDSFFISGGVGKAERERFEAVKDQYNFRLQMSTSAGAFVSEVNIEIKDAKGNIVLQTVTDGPLLMAKLPSGKYTLRASKFGETKTQTIQIGTKADKTINVFWKRDDV